MKMQLRYRKLPCTTRMVLATFEPASIHKTLR